LHQSGDSFRNPETNPFGKSAYQGTEPPPSAPDSGCWEDFGFHGSRQQTQERDVIKDERRAHDADREHRTVMERRGNASGRRPCRPQPERETVFQLKDRTPKKPECPAATPASRVGSGCEASKDNRAAQPERSNKRSAPQSAWGGSIQIFPEKPVGWSQVGAERIVGTVPVIP